MKTGTLPPTDENVAPEDESAFEAKVSRATPKASGGVIKPTPKHAVAAKASTHTPKPPSGLTRPTAASAAKSNVKIAPAVTPRAAVAAAKTAGVATPAAAGSCIKGTPGSAGGKTATRNSLGGRTPTVTMTCRYEALDMCDKDNDGEEAQEPFQDPNVSLNASHDKSSEVETSQNSAGGSSSDGNQFGSPAAVAAPQVTTTLVFSATKLIPDLTGTSVLAARSPKLRTPPHTASKIKVSRVALCCGRVELRRSSAKISGCWIFALCVCVCVCVCQRSMCTHCMPVLLGFASALTRGRSQSIKRAAVQATRVLMSADVRALLTPAQSRSSAQA